MIGFTQSSYPDIFRPSDEDYKTLVQLCRCKGRTIFRSCQIFAANCSSACTEAGSSLRLNRAVVAARLCGRLRRIVRSLQPNRAVDFFALTSQCEGIVRSIFPLPANPSEQAPARLRLPGEKPRRKSIKKEDASFRTHPPVSFTASVMQAIKLQQELQQLLQQELLLRLQQPQLQLWQQLQQLSFQLPSERLFHLLSFQLPDVPSQQPS